MYFALGDNRKYFNAADLYGIPTASLKGALCYYFVSDEFYDAVDSVLKELGFEDVKIIPQTLAEANYLLPEKMREGYAFLLDVGFLSTSVSVVYGNGIVHEESFDCGLGYILVSLMQGLGVDYETAEEILSSANISGRRGVEGSDVDGRRRRRVLGARDKRNRQVRIGRAVRKRG